MTTEGTSKAPSRSPMDASRMFEVSRTVVAGAAALFATAVLVALYLVADLEAELRSRIEAGDREVAGLRTSVGELERRLAAARSDLAATARSLDLDRRALAEFRAKMLDDQIPNLRSGVRDNQGRISRIRTERTQDEVESIRASIRRARELREAIALRLKRARESERDAELASTETDVAVDRLAAETSLAEASSKIDAAGDVGPETIAALRESVRAERDAIRILGADLAP